MTQLRNKNHELPDNSLEKVFTEFYRLREGLVGHLDGEVNTDHATTMLVTIVENMCRVMMRQRAGSLDNYREVTLQIPLLVSVARESDKGWILTDRDHEKGVRHFLKSIGKDVGKSSLYVKLRVREVDQLIEAVCSKPKLYLKNTILATSYNFQSVEGVKRVKKSVFDDTHYTKSDYKEMFDTRHDLVHSLLRKPQPEASGLVRKWVCMVENLFEVLLKDLPGMFDHYKRVALVDIDTKTSIKHLKAAADKPGSNEWTSYHLGRAYANIGDMENAKTELLKACRKVGDLRKEMEGRCAHVDPAAADQLRLDMAVLILNVGMEVERLGEDDAASECFDEAVLICGESHADLCVWAAWLQYGLNRFGEAVEYLSLAIDKTDGFWEGRRRATLYNDKGSMLSMLGRDGEAKACFEEALRLDPSLGEASKRLLELDC